MTLKFFGILFSMLLSFAAFATAPTATLTAISYTNTQGGDAVNFQIDFTGTFPLSCRIEGKTYVDINQYIFTLSLIITESKWVKIDSVWNVNGTVFPSDSVEVTHFKSGPNFLKKELLLGSSPDGGVAYLEDSSKNNILVASVASHDKDFAYRDINDNSSLMIRKTDASGSITWETFIEYSFYPIFARKAILTSDQGILITGIRNYNNQSNLWVAKINSNGSLEWEKEYGGTDYDSGQNCVELPNGDFVICGKSYSNNGDANGNHGERDGFGIKLNNDGLKKWSKQFGGSEWDEFKTVIADSLGNLYFGGLSKSSNFDLNENSGHADLFLVKTDSLGNTIWTKSFGGTGFDQITKMLMLSTSKFVMIGTSGSQGFPSSNTTLGANSILIVFDLNGNEIRNKTFPSRNPNILVLPNDEYLVFNTLQETTPFLSTNIHIFRLDSNLNEIWNSTISSSLNEYIGGVSLSSKGFYITGYSNSLGSFNDYFKKSNIFYYEMSLCPAFDAQLIAKTNIVKYDSSYISVSTNSLYPLKIQMDDGQFYSFNSQSDSIAFYSETNKTYSIVYGLNQCTLVQTPLSQLTVNVTPCPENRMQIVSPDNVSRTYQAEKAIQISSVQNTALKLEAGNSILIQPGFQTDANKLFKASIKNCLE